MSAIIYDSSCEYCLELMERIKKHDSEVLALQAKITEQQSVLLRQEETYTRKILTLKIENEILLEKVKKRGDL